MLGSKVGQELYCYPHELAKQLLGYENWSIGVELALAFNLALVMALVGYMMCAKKSRDSWCAICCSDVSENHRQGDYSLLHQTNGNHRPPLIAETIRPTQNSNEACDKDEAV